MGLTALGVIGGTGWLGGALLRPALAKGFVAAADLILSSRSGKTAGFEAWPDIRFTTDSQVLAAQSDIVILSVRPEDLDGLDLDLSGKLVISVMARVPAATLLARFKSERIIRAMPNACAEQGLSFTPWLSTPAQQRRTRPLPTVFLPVPERRQSFPPKASWTISPP
jgi:pyrroline-5-carboxylate reductase